jgi:hypothetical protein
VCRLRRGWCWWLAIGVGALNWVCRLRRGWCWWLAIGVGALEWVSALLLSFNFNNAKKWTVARVPFVLLFHILISYQEVASCQ